MGVLPQSLSRSLELCIRCGACNHACPIYNSQEKREMLGPRAYLQIPKLVEEELGISVDFIEYAYECMLCGLCDEACPIGIPISKLILSVREALIDQGYVPPSKIASMPTKLSEEKLAFGSRETKAKWLPPDHEPRKRDVLFFSTCLTSEVPESAVAAYYLLKRFMDIDTIGKEELCCGAFLRLAGYKYLSEEALDECRKQLNEFGPKKLVVLTRPCLDFIKDTGRETIHIIEAIKEAVDQGKLKFKDSKKGLEVGIIGYCDSQELNFIAEGVLSQINGIKIVEMPSWAVCGKGSLLSYKAGSKGIRGHFLKMLQVASEMKINSLIFLDSALYLIAREITRGKPKIRIYDVPQFLSMFL